MEGGRVKLVAVEVGLLVVMVGEKEGMCVYVV